MMSFLLRRMLYAIPVLLGVAFITLVLFNIAGGDPARMRLGKAASPEAVADLRAEMGLDQALHHQYWDFLTDIGTMDFGQSWADETPVTEIFMRGIGPTLSLSVPAFLIGSLLAIALSLLVAYCRGRPIDRIVTTLAIAGISVSSLVYILFGQWLLADQLKLFPIWGYEYGPRAIFFLALPICIWVLLSVGTDIRYYRTVALEEINQDYVRTARAKGLNERLILFKHVLRNCSVPIITRMTIAIPFLITGAFLLEIFFGIPGLGSELYRSITGSDFPVVKAFTMLGAVLYVLFNILADVLYALFDPRIRLS